MPTLLASRAHRPGAPRAGRGRRRADPPRRRLSADWAPAPRSRPSQPGRRRALPTRRRLFPAAVAVAATLVLAAGIAGAAAYPNPPPPPRPLPPAGLVGQALAGTLATSFHVTGTIAEGRGSSVQTVTGDVDLRHRTARLLIQLGPALPPEQVLLLPRSTYENLDAPAPVASAIPRGVRWLVQKGALTRLLLSADGALAPLQPGLPGGRVVALGHGAYRLLRAAATSPQGRSALPPDTIIFWIAHGRVVGVVAMSYSRVPLVQGGLAGVLATVTTLHLGRFGEPVRVSAPPGQAVLSSSAYELLLQSAMAAPTAEPPARPRLTPRLPR